MFDSLSSKLEKAFQVLKGHGKIKEINVAETLKHIFNVYHVLVGHPLL